MLYTSLFVFYLISTFFINLTKAANWAVIIAGSNGYYNYRHQSDISHAYQILVEDGGFPPENVISFMYDDIAYNSENPFPGELFNEPNGINYYHDINISYTGDEVIATNFLSVLKGEVAIEGKPTLKSTSEDNVFIYYSDHGATGLVAMPVGDPLYADQLLDALQYMYNNSMYNQLVFYLEACESGSMFDNILPNDINIFATTAANPDQSSYAWYYNDTLGTYMADEYSIRWMQDTENHENTFESLITQFRDVVSNVTMSNPQKYGDFKFDNESIFEFESYDYKMWSPNSFNINDLLHPYYDYSTIVSIDNNYKNNKVILSKEKHYDIALNIRHLNKCNSRDVKLCVLYNKLLDNEDNSKENILLENIENEIIERSIIDRYFRDLVSLMLNTNQFNEIEDFISMYSSPNNFRCLRGVYSIYNGVCQKWNDYSLKYVRSLVNLCENFETSIVLDAVSYMCEFY